MLYNCYVLTLPFYKYRQGVGKMGKTLVLSIPCRIIYQFYNDKTQFTAGKTVLNLREPLFWCSLQSTGHHSSTIYDWNGEFFGAVVPGDPHLLISNERRVVAKIVHRR